MNKEIQIIDNIFSSEYFESLQKMFLSNSFPWFIESDSVYENDGHPQLIHLIYRNFEPVSESWNYIKDLIGTLQSYGLYGLYRIKANGTPIYSEIVEKEFHVDMREPDKSVTPHRVAIFYINSNDGYTIFEDGTKVDSVANRMVLFPGHLKHAGTTCTNAPLRVVLNIVYI